MSEECDSCRDFPARLQPLCHPRLVRPAMSMQTLEEAMAQAVEIVDETALMNYLRKQYDFWQPTEQNVTIQPWGYDKRCDWNTYLICVDGKAALYANCPFNLRPAGA